MGRPNIGALGMAIALQVGAIAPPSIAQAAPLEEQATEVADRLVGTLSTVHQALTSRRVADVRMVTCPVTVTDAAPAPGVSFLYQEQAIALNPEQPYRQRFLRIAPYPASQSVESTAWKPPELAPWVGLCQKPLAQRRVRLADLGSPLCQVYLKPTGDRFVGATPPEGCPANFRGATRVTNQIVLEADRMETWDRGFDAAGQQVWGAQDESYQFRRLDPASRDAEVDAIARRLHGAFVAQGQPEATYEGCVVRPDGISSLSSPLLFLEKREGDRLQFQRFAWFQRTQAGSLQALLYPPQPAAAVSCQGPQRPSLAAISPDVFSVCLYNFVREGDAFVGRRTDPCALDPETTSPLPDTLRISLTEDTLEILEQPTDSEEEPNSGNLDPQRPYRAIIYRLRQ